MSKLMGSSQRFSKLISNKKFIQLVSVMILNSRGKKKVKRSSHSGDILCKRIKQSDLQRKFLVKIQELEITE